MKRCGDCAFGWPCAMSGTNAVPLLGKLPAVPAAPSKASARGGSKSARMSSASNPFGASASRKPAESAKRGASAAARPNSPRGAARPSSPRGGVQRKPVPKPSLSATDSCASRVAAAAAAASGSSSAAGLAAKAAIVSAAVATASSSSVAGAGGSKALDPRTAELGAQLKSALANEAAELASVFDEWDADHSGSIDRDEFRQAVQIIGIPGTAAEIDTLFDAWDTDKSGEIDFEELSRALKGLQVCLRAAVKVNATTHPSSGRGGHTSCDRACRCAGRGVRAHAERTLG